MTVLLPAVWHGCGMRLPSRTFRFSGVTYPQLAAMAMSVSGCGAQPWDAVGGRRRGHTSVHAGALSGQVQGGLPGGPVVWGVAVTAAVSDLLLLSSTFALDLGTIRD